MFQTQTNLGFGLTLDSQQHRTTRNIKTAAVRTIFVFNMLQSLHWTRNVPSLRGDGMTMRICQFLRRETAF